MALFTLEAGIVDSCREPAIGVYGQMEVFVCISVPPLVGTALLRRSGGIMFWVCRAVK